MSKKFNGTWSAFAYEASSDFFCDLDCSNDAFSNINKV